MKKLFFVICIFSTIIFSFSKAISSAPMSRIEFADQMQTEPQITTTTGKIPDGQQKILGIRLYRPKYNCNRQMALCIGGGHISDDEEYDFEDGDMNRFSSLYMPGEIVGDKNVRVTITSIEFTNSGTALKFVFLRDFDRNDGSDLVIDPSYNNFNVDSKTLQDLGVSAIHFTPGTYTISAAIPSKHVYGEVIIPVTVTP